MNRWPYIPHLSMGHISYTCPSPSSCSRAWEIESPGRWNLVHSPVMHCNGVEGGFREVVHYISTLYISISGTKYSTPYPQVVFGGNVSQHSLLSGVSQTQEPQPSGSIFRTCSQQALYLSNNWYN